MAYCEVEDIQTEFKDIKFDEDGSAVTTASVESFIDQAGSEIDARISVRYAVPVTMNDSALLLLKQICVWLVSDRIRDITEVKNVRTESDQDVKISTGGRARKMLAEIANGDIFLLGATLASTADGVSSFVSSNNIEREWKKSKVQW